MRFRLCALALAAVVLAAQGGSLRAACDLDAALEPASGSVVLVSGTVSGDPESAGRATGRRTCANVGCFVGTDGEVLTSLLGVVGCEEITVRCPDGRAAEGSLLAIDQAAGLALLKTELAATRPLELAEAAPGPGRLVFLVLARQEGRDVTPRFLPALVSSGDGSLRLQGVRWDGLLVADVGAPVGSAAAPVLDDEGRLAGVVLGERLRGAPAAGAEPESCVLPVGQLAGILARLQSGESRRLGWLGVSILDEPGDLEGVRVGAVLETSPAHAARIQPGDVLLEVGDEPLDDADAFARHVVEPGPRPGVRFRLLRRDRVEVVPVDVVPRPLIMYGAACGASATDSEGRLLGLAEENRLLRERIAELELRLQHLESAPR